MRLCEANMRLYKAEMETHGDIFAKHDETL